MPSSAIAGTRSSEVRLVDLVVPEHTNHYGTLYGATALQIMGKAAFICASRYAGGAVVMAKADSIEFRKPIRLGEIIDISARVVFRGRSSMTIVVDIFSDDPASASDAPISGRFMMVAVDDQGAPIPLPANADQFPRQETPS